MVSLEERLDAAERMIKTESFRQNKGLGNEIGYYVFDYPAQKELIVRERIAYINTDRIALKKQVEEALKVLVRQMLVQKNGDIYVFLTDEEQEINREIENQNVETAEVISKVSELIFEDIFREKNIAILLLMGGIILPLIKLWTIVRIRPTRTMILVCGY